MATDVEFWASMPVEHLYTETNRVLASRGWERIGERRWKWRGFKSGPSLAEIGWYDWLFLGGEDLGRRYCCHPNGMILRFEPASVTIEMMDRETHDDRIRT